MKNELQEEDGVKMANGILILFIILLLFLFMIIFSGCASATPYYDTNGNVIGISGYGFLRNLEIEQVKSDGSKISIKSTSTSADVLRAGNEIIGTMIDGAGKAIP